MHRVIGLNIVGNKVNEFCHNGLHTRRVASCVSCLQEHAVKTLVIRTNT